MSKFKPKSKALPFSSTAEKLKLHDLLPCVISLIDAPQCVKCSIQSILKSSWQARKPNSCAARYQSQPFVQQRHQHHISMSCTLPTSI
jgi:hypothetical protein